MGFQGMDQYVILLKQFVGACQANPDLLHDPKLAFYRDYLASLGANLPTKTAAPEPTPEPQAAPAEEAAPQAEPEVPKPAEIPVPQIDNEGVIPAETNEPLSMGDASKEPTDEDFEKASTERDLAMEAFSNGDLEGSLAHYTAAIEANPGSAILYAKRAK
ncbi:unnamed protein product [Caenorhabditis angaria]|uniref:Hsp70-interacting protein N-terminal domain-containing protein n=1 Tax=Caenorhabditis angaria TaxID=860376 RepID=A0A9P1IFX4_9PELO|nr:unnamed protein product [Caenorhabditis angaria]